MWSNISSPKTTPKKFGCAQQQQQVNSKLNEGQSSEHPADNHHHHSLQDVDGQQHENSGGSPLMRYKHAVCSSPKGFIYIHGGRFGNLPLDDDVWRFDAHQNSWLQLTTSGCQPPSLQEHTLVEFQDQLYLFGGQVSASSQDNSFWRLDLASRKWQSLDMKSSKLGAHLGPTNRRGHSAVVHNKSMYIFGGFEDFRGSSAQLWQYDFITERWELRNLSSRSACHPEPRHSHSAVVHDDSMFIYGGLSNLKPLGDLWRWCWRERRWFKERTRGKSPGQLHGHSAIQAFGSMFVFGGERRGRPTRSLWRLNLSNMCWQKIRPKGPRPAACTWHGAVANPLSPLDEANYIIDGNCYHTISSLSDNCFPTLESNSHSNQADNEGCARFANLGEKDERCSGSSSTAALQHTRAFRPKGANSARVIMARPISHSKSSSAQNGHSRPNSEWNFDEQQKAPPTQTSIKRKLTLSFLRKNKRMVENRELRYIQNSLSAANLLNGQSHKPQQTNAGATIESRLHASQTKRHSLATAPSANSETVVVMPADEGLKNVEILNNLDSDIKQMFECALAGDESSATAIKIEPGHHQVDQRRTMAANVTRDSMTQSQLSSLQTTASYMTARDQLTGGNSTSTITARGKDANGPPVASFARDLVPSDSMQQLTGGGGSTLTGGAASSSSTRRQRAGAKVGRARDKNRPKSEIVQSLIERADAGIKHLYAPFFNSNGQQQEVQFEASDPILGKLANHRMFERHSAKLRGDSTAVTSNGAPEVAHQRNRLSFNKSKRHTIHQTMTYYSLFFEEDVDEVPPTQQQPFRNEQAAAPPIVQGDLSNNRPLVRDDLSSNTIKGCSSGAGALSTSAALIGVRDGSSASDKTSQFSFDASQQISSESRTLCDNNTTNGQYLNEQQPCRRLNSLRSQYALSSDGDHHTAAPAEAISPPSETSGDNTSLSFSVIAEFEEDDMLQYSSPTDPTILNNQQHKMQVDDFEEDDDDENREESSLSRSIVSQSKKYLQNQHQATKAVEQQLNSSPSMSNNEPPPHQVSGSAGGASQPIAHKSASSGYDSIHSPNNNHNCNYGMISQNRTPQTEINDGSVRTSESSYGAETISSSAPVENVVANTTINPQAAAGRCKLSATNAIANEQPHTITTSSTTGDSLGALTTSEPSESSYCSPPSNSLPSSPPRRSKVGAPTLGEQQLHSPNNNLFAAQNRRAPFTSRSFFGKKQSKNRYWQLCMFVVGGKQSGAHGMNEPISIWRLYI